MADSMGLLDFLQTPAGQGLLSAGFAGLAGARRGQPINNVGRAGMAGLLGYNQAQEQKQQLALEAQRAKLFDAQMQNFQTEADARKQSADLAQQRQNYLGSVGKTTSPIVGAQPNQFDPMRWVGLGGKMEDAKGIAESKNWGRPTVKEYKDVRQPDGSVRIIGFNEFGDPINTGSTPYKAPQFEDMGGSRVAIDPVTMQPLWSGRKTNTPDALLSAETTRRGQNMVDARSREQIAQGGKAPPGYRYKPDGSMEAIPGGPADAKAQAAAQLKANGATDVDVAIGTLRDAYDRLEKGGGITSTKNGALGNASAWASSSSLGQGVGKAFGTDNQSARNDIAMARPALLAAMMKATGMSAKQMDSNAELKLWLSTATDPTLDIESNRRALANIERKYLGGSSNQDQSPAPADKPSGGLSPAEQAELQQLRDRFKGKK